MPQYRNQFTQATDIINTHVAKKDNIAWLENVLTKTRRVMPQIEAMRESDNKSVIIAALLELETTLEERILDLLDGSDDDPVGA